MEIRWLEDALADIAEIHRYIAADNPRAAARVVARIQTAIRLLTHLPHRGRPGPLARDARADHPGHALLRVFHGARRWPEEPVDQREPEAWPT